MWKLMLFGMVNASPGGMNTQKVVSSRRGAAIGLEWV
jgi:hypothetical protein